jgi:3-keto-5-aminohexanoate cleavage enzyme
MGHRQFTLAEMAVERGGHVRVGLEDNIYLERGVLARGNADLVDKVLSIASRHRRKIATPAQARKILKV